MYTVQVSSDLINVRLSWQPLLSSQAQLHFCNLSSFLAGQLSRGIGKSPYCMGMGLCVLLLTGLECYFKLLLWHYNYYATMVAWYK